MWFDAEMEPHEDFIEQYKMDTVAMCQWHCKGHEGNFTDVMTVPATVEKECKLWAAKSHFYLLLWPCT